MQALTCAYRNLLDTEFTWKQIMNADEIERARNKFIFITRISIDSIRYRQLKNFLYSLCTGTKKAGNRFDFFFYIISIELRASSEFILMC